MAQGYRAVFADPVKKRQFLFTYSNFIFNGFIALAVGALMPFIRDTLHLSYAFVGMLVGLHSVGNLFSSFTAGILPKYLGRRRSILVFNAFYTLSFVLILTTHAPWVLVLAFLFTGVARGATSNFCNIIVNDLAPGETWIFSGLHAMFAVGAFTLPLIVMAVAPIDWHIAVWVLIASGIVSFLLYLFMPLPGPRIVDTNLDDAATDDAATRTNFDATGRVTASTESAGLTPVMPQSGYGFFRDPLFWLCSLSLMTYLAAEQGVIGWLVTYFRDAGILSVYLAQVMASGLWVAILIGRLGTAYLSSRVSRIGLLITMGIGLLVFFTIMMISTNPALLVVGIAGFGLSMAGIYPTVVSFSGAIIQKFTMAWSFILTGAALGAVLMPNIIGFIAERAGIFYGMASVAGALVLTNILLWMLIRHVRRSSAA